MSGVRGGSGVVIAERFLLERIAGAGGMGTVYRAFDRQTGGPVALKILHARGADDEPRFVREAEILAELRHPGIVRYIAHGVAADGDRYLAIEWLDGESLSERVAREGLTVAESVELGIRVTEALAVAHARGVVHRDLKPSNIYLPQKRLDLAKILDFGVARMRADPHLVTQTGVLLGTPGYIAPEQARGERTVDARADVFSLGCVLFKCISGRNAFGGDDVLAVLLKVALEEAPKLRELKDDVPPALEALVARMLSKAPAERPRDAAAVVAALRDLGPLQPGAPAPASSTMAPIALTATERRVLSLVLARASGPLPRLTANDATLADAEVGDRHVALQGLAKRFGAELELIAEGTLLFVFGAKVGSHTTSGATSQARRAARCALALRTLEPTAPVGVVSGRAVVSAKTPAGDVLERGARLLNEAKAGQVRLDEVTAGLLGPEFVVGGDDEALVLKAERDAEDGTRTLLGKPTPCVGRDRELGTLDAMLDECEDEPVARGVLVVAGAGLGKSRLRYEFLRRVRARKEPVEIWLGRGNPVAVGSPFAMIAAALRRAAGVLDGEVAAVRQRKLRARLGRHLPSGDVDRVAEFLGELVGVPTLGEGSRELRAARADPMLLGDQMRRAWDDFLAAECDAQPVLLVLDDLHWGDLPTVKLVEDSLRNQRDKPFMLLALARPEVDDMFPKLWAGRGVTHLPLGELTKRAAGELVRGVLGEAATEDAVARVVERAGGNAFYLEELIRSVAQGNKDSLPETVLAVAEARLEAQHPEARRVLRAASVFGQGFWAGGVRSLLGGDAAAAELDSWLVELAAQEVVSRRPQARFPGEDEYVFRHALVREAAYAMLTEDDKALGHRLAGAWLEGVGERDPLVLAEHFERGAEPSRAVAWYRRAAQQTLGGNHFAAVIARTERGVACGATGDELGALCRLEAEARLWRGENVEAQKAARAATELLAPRSAAWYASLGDLATASGRIGDSDQVSKCVEALLAGDPAPAEQAAHVVAATRAAARLLITGHIDDAEKLLAEIERRGRPIADDNPGVLGAMRGIFAIRALWFGDPSAYLTGMELASEAYERAGDRRHACMARLNFGSVLLEVGAFADALRALKEGLAVSERMGIQPINALARCNIGMALARLGDAQAGAEVEALAIEAFTAQGDRRMEGACRIYLAAIKKLGGDLAGAIAEARAASAILEESPPTRACALARLADVLLEAGRAADALDASREAIRIIDSTRGTDEGESLARVSFARALDATGDKAGAHDAIAAARERVLARAARISVAAWRDSFLNAIPENARTLALASAWLDDPAVSTA